MGAKVAVLHTVQSTLKPISEVFGKVAPDAQVVNLLDDSLLRDTAAAGRVTPQVIQRICCYYACAQQLGAQAVLNACSSVREASELAATTVAIPVVNIDTAMARHAVNLGKRISLVATAPTTIEPSTRIIHRCAADRGKEVIVEPHLCVDASHLSAQGDYEGYMRALLEEIWNSLHSTDVVVLAQVSMATALDRVPVEYRPRVLVSPMLGVEELMTTLEASSGRGTGLAASPESVTEI